MTNTQSAFPDLPPPGPPLRIRVTRGGAPESEHLVACAVSDADGRLLAAWGDVARPVFPRSAMKALQSLPLVESGAAAACAATDRELALACASHSGEAAHVNVVGPWLQRLGLGSDDLVCGPHWPYNADAARDLAVAGLVPNRLHNNCSGEHAGMLATARHLHEPVAGYVTPDHPVQQRITLAVADMCGMAAAEFIVGIDGCSAPALALPLHRLAHGMARFGAPEGLSATRAAACRTLARAIAAEPLMVGGTGRFVTALIKAAGGRLLSKTGAEGVFVVVVPERRLALALKVQDGATRAAEAAVLALLRGMDLLDGPAVAAIEAVANPVLSNWAGLPVGTIGLVRD